MAQPLLDKLRDGVPLSERERALIAALAERPWQTRARRQTARDAAVRAAILLLDGATDYANACELSRRFCRYLTGSSWLLDQREGLPADSSPFRAACFEIARRGVGKPLGWRRIIEIVRATH